jgi:hypothetical protein
MSQFLSDTNTYQRQLITFGNDGLVYVVACTDENSEPEYEGFATAESAIKRCDQVSGDTLLPHAVYHLRQDEDECWICDYQDIR